MTAAVDPFHVAFGQRLRAVRKALGLTEREAAIAAGVRVRTYRRWEAGFGGKSSRPIFKFGRQFGVDLDWLFSGKPFDRRVLH